MNRGADFFVSQLLNKLIAIDLETIEVQLDHKQMPRMLDSVSAGRELNLLKIGESFCVIHRDTFSSPPNFLPFPQLFNPVGSRTDGQIIVKSRVDDHTLSRTCL